MKKIAVLLLCIALNCLGMDNYTKFDPLVHTCVTFNEYMDKGESVATSDYCINIDKKKMEITIRSNILSLNRRIEPFTLNQWDNSYNKILDAIKNIDLIKLQHPEWTEGRTTWSYMCSISSLKELNDVIETTNK